MLLATGNIWRSVHKECLLLIYSLAIFFGRSINQQLFPNRVSAQPILSNTIVKHITGWIVQSPVYKIPVNIVHIPAWVERGISSHNICKIWLIFCFLSRLHMAIAKLSNV